MIKSFLLFESGAAHVVFSDRSSLILHCDGNSLTYFTKSGTKYRQTYRSSQASDNFQAKLHESMRLCNRFSGALNLQLHSVDAEYDAIIKHGKVKCCVWEQCGHIHDLDDALVIESMDRYACVRMHKQTLSIRVQYYHLIANRLTAMKDATQDSYSYVSSFLNKYNINSKVPTPDEESKVKLGFTYYQVTKEYSLYNYPPEWTLPIMLLWQQMQKTINANQLALLNIHFPDDMDHFVRGKNVDDESNILKLYSTQRLTETQFSTKLPSKVAEEGCLSNFKFDDVPPASDFLSQIHLTSKPTLYYSQDLVFWFHHRQAQVAEGIGYQTNQLLYRINNYWHKIAHDTDSLWLDGDNIESVREVNALFRHFIQLIQLQPEAKPSNQVKKDIYNIIRGDMDLLREVNITNVGNFVALKNGTIKCKFLNRTLVSFIYPPPCELNVMDSYGSSQKIYFDPQDDQLESTQGMCRDVPETIKFYVEHCVEFAEDCFVKMKIQEHRQKNKQKVSSWVESELQKGRTFLYLTGGSDVPTEAVTSSEPVIDLNQQIQNLLEANQRMLQLLKE